MGNPQNMFFASPKGINGALRQGEILSSVFELQIVLEDTLGKAERCNYEADAIEHPFAIIVSQDCDLEQDFNYRFHSRGKERHQIPSVFFCQAMDADDFRKGDQHKHLFNSSTFENNFKHNDDFRFHFVQKIPPEYDALNMGLPELAMEFKRYFSMPTAEVYHRVKLSHTWRRCHLKSPYLEHFCDRFHYFNNRIALPEEYESV